MYTPAKGQLGNKATDAVLGHVYAAGRAAVDYAIQEASQSIFAITLTGAADLTIDLDPADDGFFGASHNCHDAMLGSGLILWLGCTRNIRIGLVRTRPSIAMLQPIT